MLQFVFLLLLVVVLVVVYPMSMIRCYMQQFISLIFQKMYMSCEGRSGECHCVQYRARVSEGLTDEGQAWESTVRCPTSAWAEASC